MMLHITNGDSVVHSFRDGGIPGAYLPWRDVLHDGPVPQCASLEALSDIRARQFAGPGEYEHVREEFGNRDRTLARFADFEEVVLWFEHDLYDQLQLLQILDFFSRQDLLRTTLSMIQIGEHPDVKPFHGLGQLTGAQLAALLPTRKPVTRRQLDIGHIGWTAFCSPEPSALRHFAGQSDPEMPFMQAAMQRLLEELPSADDRLSRSERQILSAAAAGATTREEILLATWRMEACPWGDLSVFDRVDRLASGSPPALERRGDSYALNDHGRRLLARDPEAVRARTVDTWVGGAHVIIR